MADLNIDEFDFGFTAVDESELDAVQTKSAEVSAAADTIKDAEEKLNKLYNAILPLLSNLKKNPEKDYILWPNRLKKVEEFEEHLSKIYQQ